MQENKKWYVCRLILLRVVLAASMVALGMGGRILFYMWSSERIDATSFVRDVSALSGGDRERKSCFGGFLAGLPEDVRQDVESATILLVKDHGHGKSHIGSGFIVRASGTPNSPLNKVVTSRHLLDSDGSPRLMGVSSNGTSLGFFHVVWSPDGEGEMDDVAVLEWEGLLGTTDAEAYRSIPGLVMAPRQHAHMLNGMSGGISPLTHSLHPGAGPGLSGSPLIDTHGLVHGILKSTIRDAPEMFLSDIGYNVNTSKVGLRTPWPGPGKDISVSMSVRVHAVPLGNPDLLLRLGAAGRDVSMAATSTHTDTDTSSLAMVGYLSGLCVSTPFLSLP